MKSVCTKIWKFSWCLDSLEFIKNSREFSRNFTSRSRGIFISLFTLGLDLETFSFHFSLSISISRHFHFTFHSRNGWTRFLFHFSKWVNQIFTSRTSQYPLSQDTAPLLPLSLSSLAYSCPLSLKQKSCLMVGLGIKHLAKKQNNKHSALLHISIFANKSLISII